VLCLGMEEMISWDGHWRMSACHQGGPSELAPFRSKHDMVLCAIAPIRLVHGWVLARGTQGKLLMKSSIDSSLRRVGQTMSTSSLGLFAANVISLDSYIRKSSLWFWWCYPNTVVRILVVTLVGEDVMLLWNQNHVCHWEFNDHFLPGMVFLRL